MIGAVVAKRKACSGFDALSRHDLAKIMSDWAEDGTFTFPRNISISGVHKGKKAIEVCFAKMFEMYPRFDFHVKEVYISNIFALGATNNVAV
jgi:ketosteroid isomerase-like protein